MRTVLLRNCNEFFDVLSIILIIYLIIQSTHLNNVKNVNILRKIVSLNVLNFEQI